MTSSELLPATVLSRKAIVYVRQSTQSQVMTNLESQRRQYDAFYKPGRQPVSGVACTGRQHARAAAVVAGVNR